MLSWVEVIHQSSVSDCLSQRVGFGTSHRDKLLETIQEPVALRFAGVQPEVPLHRVVPGIVA